MCTSRHDLVSFAFYAIPIFPSNSKNLYITCYNTGADEFVAWECFLPGKISLLTLSVLMSSVLTNYASVHVCISVEVLVKAHAVEHE